MDVHNQLGPGLKEEVYQRGMEAALERSGLNYEPQKQIEVYLGKRRIGLLFIDVLVEKTVVVEFKALTHQLTNNEIAQVVTYLRAEGASVGLLLNFGRKYLEYKRVFPPKKISEFGADDVRFGVRLAAEGLSTNKTVTNKRIGAKELSTNIAITDKRIVPQRGNGAGIYPFIRL